MKVLLTGHKGFIGGNVLRSIPDTWSVRYYDLQDNYDLRVSDLELDQINWVLHIGAISSTTETDWSKIARHNISFSIELFERCVDAGVNFQFSSSASVYGSSTTFKESDTKNPSSYYATSKAVVEDYISYRQPKNIQYQMFRYFNVFGPGEDHKIGQSSPHSEFTRQAKTYGRIQVFEGSEHFKRDFVPISAIVNTHFNMMHSQESGVWNVGTGKATSFMQVAKQIANQYSVPIEIIPFPDRLQTSYQKFTCANTDKLFGSLASIRKR